jgi:hypothetical protein
VSKKQINADTKLMPSPIKKKKIQITSNNKCNPTSLQRLNTYKNLDNILKQRKLKTQSITYLTFPADRISKLNPPKIKKPATLTKNTKSTEPPKLNN